MKAEIKKYAEGLNASSEVLDWIEKRVLEPINQKEAEHIIDFLVSDKCPKNLERATYQQMKSNAEKWNQALIKKVEHIKEKPEDIEVVLDFKDGFKIVKLIGKNAYEREGFLMRHCVSSYFGKDDEIYSLRDKNNMPHATMSKSSQQIKGKGNGSIHPDYVSYVVQFLEYLKIEVRDSEMLNLGYLNLEKFKEHLHKDIIDNLFKEKYWFKENKIFDKDGKEWASLELLDQLPLIAETRTDLKINFELPSFIKSSIDFFFKQIKKISGDSSQLASSGNSSKLAVNGKMSVGAGIGINNTINGKIGCWITLAEWKKEKDIWKPIGVKSVQIDGKKIKADTWYKLKDNEFVEVKYEQ